MKAWTDYPFDALGDAAGKEAKVRECEVIAYDGDKYVTVIVEGHKASIKAGYVYELPGRCGDVPRVRYASLARLPVDLGAV